MVPLLIVLAKRPNPLRAMILGWVAGSVFFYASCYWLTYSMIHYGGLPAWLWWVLAALLAALAAYLILRARRRAAWDAEVAEAEAEVSWLGRELLAQLQQTTTTDALAGGWQVSAARVREVEDRLTGLEASAPDEQRAARATELRDAVRSSRTDVETLIATRDEVGTPAVLAAATSRLVEALNPPPPPPTP